ncbi:MAG TPA: hypothetical protein VHG32_09540 [Thermoanaerobaculia bacterium]|jgi:hypothetical protein|nr:hypothetical protein [Thermoanaerobaculia bacterium]
MSLDPKTVFKKAAARAAISTGNVMSGAGALVASAAIWNPLPLVLWGLGSAAWVLFASTSPRFTRRVLDDERRAAEAAADRERQALHAKIESVLSRPWFAAWLRAGLLPDYLQIFARLVAVRDRVAQTLAERHDDFLASLGLQQQLTQLVGAYLQFVQARLTVLQLLADFRPAAAPAAPAAPAVAAPPPHRRGFAADAPGAPAQAGAVPRAAGAGGRAPAPPIPDVAALIADLDQRIAELHELAAREPATAKTRGWHIGILQKQQELLRDCAGRDQQLVAQLTAVPDAFDVIAGRISAAQFDPTELAAYAGGVVEQVEETEKFVQAMGPAMSEMLRPAGSAAAGGGSQPAGTGTAAST